MKVVMPTIANPGSFVYDSTQPTKYTEAASFALHQTLYALSEAEYEIANGEELEEIVQEGLLYQDQEEEWQSILKKALLSQGPSEESYSILWALAQIPIQILIDHHGDLAEIISESI